MGVYIWLENKYRLHAGKKKDSDFLAGLLTTKLIRCAQEDEWLLNNYDKCNASIKSTADSVSSQRGAWTDWESVRCVWVEMMSDSPHSPICFVCISAFAKILLMNVKSLGPEEAFWTHMVNIGLLLEIETIFKNIM
jgi:hypothetical protein